MAVWWYVEGPWGGAWRASGPDTWGFLQSQAANDLRRVAPQEPVWTLWLKRTGQVRAATWVRRTPDGAAELRAEAAPDAGWAEGVEAGILADEVEWSDVTNGWLRVTVAAAGWERLAPGAPEGVAAWRSREVPDAWELDVPAAVWPQWRAQWEALGGTAEEAAWREAQRVAAGVPAVPADVGPEDLPQEAGLDATGLSYTKGCYLGQEVMARLKSQGRTRRSLVRLRLAPGAPVEPGAALWHAGEAAGTLRSMGAVGATGGRPALAMVKHVAAAPATALTDAAGNAVAEVTGPARPVAEEGR